MMNATQGQAVDELIKNMDLLKVLNDEGVAHRSSQEHEPKEDSTEWWDVVTVFWDIKGFPVPHGLDARQVCLDIINYLEVEKYSGPFTIEVIGLLTHVPTDVLQALWSFGIILKNVPFDSTDIINQWISVNPPPANMLVLSPYYSKNTFDKFLAPLKEQGYNIMVPFCFKDWGVFCHGAYSVRIKEEDFCSETEDADDSWFCSVSHEISGKSIEDFITHLSQEHKPTEIVAAVTVFWDINGFPVPFCCEARKVCHYINRFLENSYYGPFTINAIGLLTRVPSDVLRVLSSFGIILNHVPFDFTDIMNQWISVNPPPANALVLSPYYSETFDKFLAPLEEQGYNIIELELNYLDWQLWQHSCLEDPETLKEEEDTCSETDASWVCSVCHDISGKGFENFMTHLSQKHVHEEVRVERLSVLAAPSECHEKNEEAVEAGVEALPF